MTIFPYELFIHNFSIINLLYPDVSFHWQTNDFTYFITQSELELAENFNFLLHHFGFHLLGAETSYLEENCSYFKARFNILKKNSRHHVQLKVLNLYFQEQTYSQIWKCSFENFFAFIKFKSCYIKQNHHFSLLNHHQTYEFPIRFQSFMGDCTLQLDHELQKLKKLRRKNEILLTCSTIRSCNQFSIISSVLRVSTIGSSSFFVTNRSFFQIRDITLEIFLIWIILCYDAILLLTLTQTHIVQSIRLGLTIELCRLLLLMISPIVSFIHFLIKYIKNYSKIKFKN